MKGLIAVCLSLFTSQLLAQDCSCSSQLSFVIDYFEKNNPAFQKIKTVPGSYATYLKEVQKIKSLAGKEKNVEDCILYMDRYVTLLKDHHSGIGYNLQRLDLSTPALIADFKKSPNYLQFKKIPIDTARLIPLLAAKKTADIEGIYTDGRTIVIGIIKKEKSTGKYLGVVLKANKLLDAGHVLLELSGMPGNAYNISYNVGLLGFNFKKIVKNQVIENGQIPSLGFSKTITTASRDKSYELSALNDSSNYLRLGSFDGKLTAELDSFYQVVDKQVRSKPYLIVDLRRNGGGSEGSYLNLLKYAYSRPLKIDSATIWVSPENIKRYEENAPGANEQLIQRMKAAKPFTFIPLVEEGLNTWTLDSATVYPKKIALLFDRGTASAAEGMILYYMQSDKVITMGENSGGYIGYGNVMTAQTACKKFTVQSTTTRYFEKSNYEFVGIEPMYKLSKKQDWIKTAGELLLKAK